MEKELPDEPNSGEAGALTEGAPAVVLPSPNTQSLMGGIQGGTTVIPSVTPQPFVAPLEVGSGTLISRVEQAIDEDGRFSAFLVNLSLAEQGGTVTVSGAAPSETQRRSLLEVVRAVPGVAAVRDEMRVA
jgi:hypothetical protein